MLTKKTKNKKENNLKPTKTLIATCLYDSYFNRRGQTNELGFFFYYFIILSSSRFYQKFRQIFCGADERTGFLCCLRTFHQWWWRRKCHDKQERIKNVNGHCFGRFRVDTRLMNIKNRFNVATLSENFQDSQPIEIPQQVQGEICFVFVCVCVFSFTRSHKALHDFSFTSIILCVHWNYWACCWCR